MMTADTNDSTQPVGLGAMTGSLTVDQMATEMGLENDQEAGRGSPLPRLVLPLVKWGGDQYPMIAELRGGFKLVAHKNAPAITNGDLFSTLDQHDDDQEWLTAIKRDAWTKYEAWTWKILRPLLDCPTYGKND